MTLLHLSGSACCALAQVLTVASPPGPGEYPNIQTALDAAVDGDAIVVAAGTYPSFVVFAKDVSIAADSAQSVLIEGGFAVRALLAEQSVVVRGLTVIDADETGLSIKNNQLCQQG